MHYENYIFWERCKWKYSRYFKEPSKVIEMGAAYINGTIKAHFWTRDYTGVDYRNGYNVDLQSLAHEVSFEPETFDTVASASMLEHDPHWEKSIKKMVEILKPDGIMMLSWGAALNPPHLPITSPDGGYHPLKAETVIRLLESLDMYIHEFQYENSLLDERGDFIRPNQGWGEVVLVAFKDKKYAIGEQLIDPFLDEDRT